MLEGKKISFKHTQKCEPYAENGQYLTTKEVVIHDGLVIDKYRGSANGIDSNRGLMPLALIDYYLVSKDYALYHVLPKDIIGIN